MAQYREIPVGLLVKDEANGRLVTDPAVVRQLVRNWHWPSCEVLTVHDRRDGLYGVLEGWHRREAVMEKFGPNQTVMCKVEDLSDEDKRTAFLNMNKKKPISTYERFMVRLERGDVDAVDIAGVVEKCGAKLAAPNKTSSERRCVEAVTSLEEVYRMGGSSLLSLTLAVLTAAWPEADRYRKETIRGVGAFLRKYPEADLDRLVTRLATLTPFELEEQARNRTTSGWRRAFMETALRSLYNHHLSPSSSRYLV